MKYKLMAVDIDGTLLDSHNVLRQETIDAISQGVSQGLIFMLATGRPIQGVQKFNEILGLDLPYITYNGAMVVMGASRNILYEQCLSNEDAQNIYKLGEAFHTTMIVWSQNNLYVSEMNERAGKYSELAKTPATLIGDVSEICKAGVTKILWYDTVENIQAFQSDIRDRLGDGVTCHTSKPYFLEFVDKNASKAIAMAKIGEHFGIQREEMIAIGDGENDLSMIEYAGLGVAMGNAIDEVKEKADYITLSNDENGVAHVIRTFVLQ
jgi:Cof subfamily protein (haloacid dehalogenase superfamily)